MELGFAREQIVVIDEDLGISGSGMSERSGFARLAAEVALGHAGLVLGLEVSRAGPQQRRLVPAAGFVRRDGHGDRRRRRPVSPRLVQRPAPARSQRHDE